jgi:hypothetical protein
MKHNFEDIGNDWQRIGSFYHVEEWRDGWLGVWDALLAAIWRRYDRPRSLKGYTISLYLKPTDDGIEGGTYVFGGQVEDGKVAKSYRIRG